MLAGTAEDEKLVDDQGQPIDLRHRRLELSRDAIVPAKSIRQGLEPQPQAGQGGPQLMGRIGDEVLLDAKQSLDPLGHLVEGAGQRTLLGGPFDRDGDVEVTARDVACRPIEASDRSGDLLGDQGGGNQGQEQHHPRQRRKVEERGSDGAAHGRDALGHPDGAVWPAVLEHRHGGGKDVLTERLAVAGDLLAPSFQRRPDLRAAGIASPGFSTGRICNQTAPAVDHDHPPAHARGGDIDKALESRPPSRAEELRS